jgi:hypothetical protein
LRPMGAGAAPDFVAAGDEAEAEGVVEAAPDGFGWPGAAVVTPAGAVVMPWFVLVSE